jgi:hypothetical protein
MFNIDSLRRFYHASRRSWNALSWSEQLILMLALCSYLTLGIFLGLLSNGSDFIAFYQAAHRVVTGHGAEIYQEFFTVDPARNPIMFAYTAPTALLFAPLAFLNPSWVWPVFQMISHGCLWAAWWLAVQEAQDRNIPEPRLRMAAGLLLFFPIYLSLWLGQCEVLLLVLLFGAMRLNRRGYSVLAGLAIATAICMKIFLGFLLIYFLVTRRFRLLVSCLGGLIFLEAASLFVVPLDVQLHFWHFAPIWTARIQPFFDNYAVSGPIFRLLTANYYTHGIVDWFPIAQILTWTVSGLIGVVFVYRVRRFSAEDFGAGFSYALVTSLLVSPLTDTHHFALLLIPFLFHAFHSKGPGAGRWFYCFFAAYVPIVAFAFLDVDRYKYFTRGVATLIFALPFFVLLTLWLYLPNLQESEEEENGQQSQA